MTSSQRSVALSLIPENSRQGRGEKEKRGGKRRKGGRKLEESHRGEKVPSPAMKNKTVQNQGLGDLCHQSIMKWIHQQTFPG